MKEAVLTEGRLGWGWEWGKILLLSSSVQKEFLWSGMAMGHQGWACIPDNTYSVLLSGDLCQGTQRMGCPRAKVYLNH